VKITMVQY